MIDKYVHGERVREQTNKYAVCEQTYFDVWSNPAAGKHLVFKRFIF